MNPKWSRIWPKSDRICNWLISVKMGVGQRQRQRGQSLGASSLASARTRRERTAGNDVRKRGESVPVTLSPKSERGSAELITAFETNWFRFENAILDRNELFVRSTARADHGTFASFCRIRPNLHKKPPCSPSSPPHYNALIRLNALILRTHGQLQLSPVLSLWLAWLPSKTLPFHFPIRHPLKIYFIHCECPLHCQPSRLSSSP